jgi:hypothetical protein
MFKKLFNLLWPKTVEPSLASVVEKKSLKVGTSWVTDEQYQKDKIDQHFAAMKHQPYSAPKGVVPEGVVTGDSVDYAYLNNTFTQPDSVFMGYPVLANLAQKSENRIACEQSVNEIFRKGFKVKSNDTKANRETSLTRLRMHSKRSALRSTSKGWFQRRGVRQLASVR